MESRKLLPDARSVRCEDISMARGVLTVTVTSTRAAACCPLCGVKSTRVHSRYWRTLADLPVSGMRVAVRWHTRRFFCVKPSCERRIFAERLEKIASAYGRRTSRLNDVVRSIALTCGGEAGARLADRLSISTSPDTMLREIQRTRHGETRAPRVIGIDDWAWRKGQRYGTIIVDLEKREPIDLLPDRSAETLSAWLRKRPSVELISRDRGDCFIKGATCGAPAATQVADRFHIVVNLREAIKRLLDRHPQDLNRAARAVADRHQESPPSGNTPLPPPGGSSAEPTKGELRRRQLFASVVAMHAEGYSRREIARRLGVNRNTVGRYIDTGGFPERATRTYLSGVDRFADYLWQRWQEGIRNARRLTQELRQQGFRGSYWMVRRHVSAWRPEGPAAHAPSCRFKRPSSQRVSGLFVAHSTNLSATERDLLREVKRQCPEARTAARLANQFLSMVRGQGSALLQPWIKRASGQAAPKELRGFAAGLKKDIQAIRNALDLPWSNGPTEGFVNRLKMLKRQMYGRAGFALLRKRVLFAT